MAGYTGTFKCVILSPKSLIYENEVHSIFLTGDRGEYELLAYHYAVLGILKEGSIIINWKESVPIQGGVVRFYANECIILVEEEKNTLALAKH